MVDPGAGAEAAKASWDLKEVLVIAGSFVVALLSWMSHRIVSMQDDRIAALEAGVAAIGTVHPTKDEMITAVAGNATKLDLIISMLDKIDGRVEKVEQREMDNLRRRAGDLQP